jgi:SSS family transporter
MNWLDYSIVLIYSVGLIGMGYFFKNSKNSQDYFLGGKSFGWFPLSMSTMATQLSAISFVSAPAFVGLLQGGGMKWLTFEFGVPLAMIFVMFVIIPPLWKAGVVSIYAFLEQRFDRSTRLILSFVFQISRALGTGVMVFLIAIILKAVLGISLELTVLIISIITLIYSYQGGMKAVIWGDTIQMLILLSGLFIMLGVSVYLLMQNGGVFTHIDMTRLEVVNFSKFGLSNSDGNDTYGFWPMVLGGFFLYASYYGTDQTQAQRTLSASSLKTVRQTLMVNGLFRFPVVLVYCIMGLLIGGLVVALPDYAAEINEKSIQYYADYFGSYEAGLAAFAEKGNKVDLMVPVFITRFLPHGVIGLLIIAIMSAAMSSLSSTINSLSAVSVEDLFNHKKQLDSKKYLRISRISVLFWGLVCIGSAFLFGKSESPVIEIINAVGSIFYGPILATFLLAIFNKKLTAKAMNFGILSTVAIHIYVKLPGIFGVETGWSSFTDLALIIDQNVFWIWFNVSGFLLTFITAYIFQFISKSVPVLPSKLGNIDRSISLSFLREKESVILILFFIIMILFSVLFPSFFKL